MVPCVRVVKIPEKYSARRSVMLGSMGSIASIHLVSGGKDPPSCHLSTCLKTLGFGPGSPGVP